MLRPGKDCCLRMEWEFNLLNWIQSHLRGELLDAVMPAVTFLGNGGWFWILLTLLGFIPQRTRKYAHVAAFALILHLLFCNLILKPLIARLRPFQIQAINLLIDAPSDFSFPSGHTQAAFSVATAICMWRRRYGIPALILATVIAFSRMYLYVHYPTDIFAGIFFGVSFAFVGLAIANRLFRNKPWDGCDGEPPQP